MTGDTLLGRGDQVAQASRALGPYDGRTAKRVAPAHVQKLRDILGVLDRSSGPQDMALPGFRLHPLRGDLAGYWTISVSGNWRVTFRFLNGDAVDVDYLDYH